MTTMTEDGRNALIVQSVIDLGHNLGLSIVAEGVEDEQTSPRSPPWTATSPRATTSRAP